MYKVSVIVPVYNTEKYLKKCLDSLVHQTLKEIEIILINDGSTDNSQKIIDEYVLKYPKLFKVFSQKNSGQAVARNLGIKNSKGEFIAFADSDDYLEIDAYEKAYNYAVKNNLDIVCFKFYEDKNGIRKKSSYELFKTYDKNLKYILNETSPCNKIIKNDLLKNNKIKFIENYIYEDLELIPKLALYTDKIGFLDEYLYNYVIHNDSTMRQKNYNQKLDSIYFVMDSLKNNFKNSKYTKELEFLFVEHLLHGGVLRYLEYKEGNKDIEKISDIIKENFPNWKKNVYYKKQNIKYKIICTLAYNKKIKLLKKILKK